MLGGGKGLLDRLTRWRGKTYLAGGVVIAVTAGLTQGIAGATPNTAPPVSSAGGASPTGDFGADANRSQDLVVDGFGDSSGYHLQVATGQAGFAWRQVAVLKPAGLDDRSWTGYQCVSGDGKYAAVAVLPISAINTIAARDHGAFAFGVDLATGAVTPLARGVALQYHSPGCGTADEAAFTVSLGADEQKTEILEVDLAAGKVLRTAKVDGQVTSVVPAEGGQVGVRGSTLVKIDEHGTAAKLATVGGTAIQLRSTADTGVDFVALPADGKAPARVLHERAGAVSEIAHGDRGSLQVFAGRAGHTVISGAAAGTGADGRVVVDSKGLPHGATTASLDGDALVGAAADGQKDTPVTLSTKTHKLVARDRATGGGTTSTAVPAFQPDGVAQDQRPQSSAGQPQPKGDAASSSSPQSGGHGLVLRSQAAPQTVASAQTPKCAVPRLAENRQVMQPSPAQIDWASQLAEQNALTAANGYSRPAGFANLGLNAYAPNDNFPKIPLSHPAGDSWDSVPRSVFDAIMAQESNWNQASWHALPGMASDPLLADYYGAGGDIYKINYAGADCGYGVGQATTGMDTASTGVYLSVNGQTKVAVDYQENIAYSLQILQTTWNTLYGDGIILNDGSPRYLENWYFAAWAYNSGMQPNATHGNTTGCTPSATCTGPDGTWGLGWANNPLNPVYPPGRAPYLKTTYADAAHPGDWPYQERILGWISSPLLRGGHAAYAPPTYHGGNSWPLVPGFATFCTMADNKCQPGTVNQDTGACTLADSECWWHAPATSTPNCAQVCTTSDYTTSGGSEPTVNDPWPPSCQVDYSKLGGGSGPVVIVDEAQSSPPLNLQGCGNPNWSQGGTFNYAYGTNPAGDPIGAIDTHQLGAGLGGHTLFTHTVDGSRPEVVNTGTWTPNLPGGAQNYKIKLHIPSIGATATNVVYKIYPGGGVAPWQYRVNQNWQSEQWVTIATVAMQPGGYVQMNNQSPVTGGTNAIDYSNFDVGYDAVAFIPMGAGTVVGGPPKVIDAPKGSNPSFINCGCARRTAGDPVDTSTGYFGDTFTDLTTPGRLPLSLTRTYAESIADPAGPNGSLAADGPFGYGWTFTYNSSAATDTASGNVTIRQEDGSSVTFLPQSGGGYAPSAPRYDATLSKSGASYTFTRRGRDIFTFDTVTGRLQSQTDLAGSKASTPYAIIFGYDGVGHLSTITDPANRKYTLAWTGNHITGVSDTAGRQVTYGYDSNSNLTDVYGVGTTRTPTLKDDDHMQFGYQAPTHLMTSMRTPKNYGVTTTPAPVTSMTYDTSERVLTQTDPLGHATTFTYGPDGGLAAGQVLVTDPAGHKVLHTYSGGLLVSETKGYGSSAAATTSYTYDPVTLGISSITDPRGNLQTFSYDDHGNRISSSDARGFATNYVYDDHGDPIETIDPQGVRTTHNYDDAGHIALPGGGTNPGGFAYGDLTSTTTTQTGPSSEIVNSGTDPLPSRTTNYFYDDPAHPGDRTRNVDANNNTAKLSYDAYGYLSTATDAQGGQTQLGYDPGTGWPTSAVSANGSAVGVKPGCTAPAKGCTTYRHDARGNLVSATDALGKTTTSHYDANGNKTSTTDANGHTTSYGFDANDRPTTTTRSDGTTATTDYNPDDTVADTLDGASNKTTYGYDPLGRRVSSTNPDGMTTSSTVDGVGNVLTTTNAAGQVTTYTYDPASAPLTVTYSDGSTPNVTFAYNSAGRRVSMTDGTGTSKWSYDAFGEVTTQTNGAKATVSYGYDRVGNQNAITYPGRTQPVVRGFDSANRLTSVIDWNNQQSTFGYDNDGDLKTSTYPNGTVVANSYDDSDGLRTSALTAGTSPLASLTFTRDNNGNVASQTPVGVPGAAETYGYTALDQVKTVNSTGYAYDAAENPITVGTTTQTFTPASRLCWTAPGTPPLNPSCATPPATATTYGYNKQGDRTSGAAGATYSYNQADQLITATGQSGPAGYTYDGDGLRAAKSVGGVSYGFTWDSAAVPNLLSDGATSYVYGPGGLPIEQVTASGAQWFFHDHLGSTRALTDNTGAIVGTYNYSTYGTTTGHSGPVATALQYTGQYTDGETGFLYLRARYYDPATAQFLTVDPEVATTRSAYAYVGDNPLNRVDPTGKWFFLAALIPFAPAVFTAIAVVVVVAVVALAVIGAIDYFAHQSNASSDPSTSDVVSNLKNGRSRNVKTVDSDQELGQVWDKLSKDGKPLDRPNYKGKWVQRPNGDCVGLREESSSGGRTIDVVSKETPVKKIHVEGG